MEPQRDSAAATSTETSLLLEASNILQLLPNATGFKLVGGQVVLGNVNNHQSPVSVALGSTQTLPSPPAVASNAGPIRRPSPPRRLAASEIYCEKLLYEQRGFPLYVPQPHMHLPEEYRRTGVAIGDVGRVTPEGAFDFLFNIYCPREHPINANGVPENFSPLPPYLVSDLFCLDYAPGDYVSTLSVEELDAESSDDFPGGEFGFKCNGPDGAVLALPHGARLEKLENLETMLRYAAKNAESWYKHINGPGGRGRQLVNGFLYLITGCEKSQSWGMASFQNIAAEREFQLRFKPNADATAGWKYRWRKGTPARTKCFMNSAEPNLANQTLFLHGFSISLGEGIWGKLFGDVSVGPIADFRGGKSRSQLVPFGSQGSSGSRSLGLGSRTAQNGHDMDALRSAPADQEDEDVQLCHFSPTPTFLHPSQLVNSYLTQKAPLATVVITHDDDWGHVFRNDIGNESTIRSPSELVERILAESLVVEEDGAIFLVPKADVTSSDDWCDVLSDGSCLPVPPFRPAKCSKDAMPGQNHPEAPEAMFERFEIMEEHGAAFLPETKNDGTTAEEVNFVPASAEIVLGSTDDGSAVEDEYAPPSNLPPMTTPKSEYTNAQWWPSAPDTPSSYFPSSPFHSQGTTPELSPQTLELPVLHPQVASMAAVHASNLRRTKHARFFYCDLCGAELTTRHNLKNHKNAHAGLRPHVCTCGSAFTTLVVLRRHQKKCKRFAGLA